MWRSSVPTSRSVPGILARWSWASGPLALQWCLTLGLAGGMLWLVGSSRSPAGTGQVVLHVTEPDVEVRLGPIRFEFQDRVYAPLTVDLPPGRYDLRVHRRGALLHSESFDVVRGEGRVLTAYDGRPR